MGRAPAAKKRGDDGLDDAEETVLAYMCAQNRPYGAQDVFANLHGAVGKTAVVRALAALAEKGRLAAKTYGKSAVYVARQDDRAAPSPEELAALDADLDAAAADVAAAHARHRETAARVSALLASPATPDVRSRIAALRGEIEEMETRLAALRSGAAGVDPAEKARTDARHALLHREWRARRRLCLDAVRAVTENLPQSPAAFMEQLGMETDAGPGAPKNA